MFRDIEVIRLTPITGGMEGFIATSIIGARCFMSRAIM